MIHHSALSFRKLTSMKIVDRSSCYIVGISKDLADKAMLAKYELFGQFGDILSIRIIQDKDPCEVYIRFATQSSAVRAIDWCNGHAPCSPTPSTATRSTASSSSTARTASAATSTAPTATRGQTP